MARCNPNSGGERSPAERLAELMAWHGMARYADPDDLAAHVQPADDLAGNPPTA